MKSVPWFCIVCFSVESVCLRFVSLSLQSTERSDSEEVNFIKELVKKLLIIIARPARLLECLVRYYVTPVSRHAQENETFLCDRLLCKESASLGSSSDDIQNHIPKVI